MADQPTLIDVPADPLVAARHRAFSRHQHAAVSDVKNNERYTLRPTLEECMRFAGVVHIDIDCAACPEAHVADEWLGLQVDGSFRDALGCSWRPTTRPPDTHATGWLNPPYDMLEAFTERGVLAVLDGQLQTLIMLPPGDRCEQPWWQKWIEPHRDDATGSNHIHRQGGIGMRADRVRVRTWNLPGRQRFGSPGDPRGLCADSAPFPSVCVVFERVG